MSWIGDGPTANVPRVSQHHLSCFEVFRPQSATNEWQPAVPDTVGPNRKTKFSVQATARCVYPSRPTKFIIGMRTLSQPITGSSRTNLASGSVNRSAIMQVRAKLHNMLKAKTLDEDESLSRVMSIGAQRDHNATVDGPVIESNSNSFEPVLKMKMRQRATSIAATRPAHFRSGLQSLLTSVESKNLTMDMDTFRSIVRNDRPVAVSQHRPILRAQGTGKYSNTDSLNSPSKKVTFAHNKVIYNYSYVA